MPRLTLSPRAILVDVIPPTLDKSVAERRIVELDALTHTYGGITVVKIIQKRSVPDYRTYIGSGKLQEIIQTAKQERAELVIVNNLLKAKQMFTIGEMLRPHKMVVWDRIDLILKIFQKHATTSEAKLQIKLAALHHMGPRIFGMGMEMMQQAGGTGTRGGPGETNTEIMKRHLAEQERHFKKELQRIATSREGHRDRRRRLGFKTASIIGYTNAGKSSLLNALTRKGAYAADELFATLDTRVAKLFLPVEAAAPAKDKAWQPLPAPRAVLLSDTIGFIQDLPPELISAFRSTLDETVHADILLHVIDASDPYLEDKINDVESILAELDIRNTPEIYVFNKMDRADKKVIAALRKKYKDKTPVLVSAATGTGLEDLKAQLNARLEETETRQP